MFNEWDVGKVERGLTAKAFMNWVAYAQLEPLYFNQEARADWRMAAIRETVFNVAVERKHRRPLKDFMLPFDEPPKPQERPTQEQLTRKIHLLAAMFGGLPKSES